MNLLTKGNKARTMEATKANKTSSRSHALLSVTVRKTLKFPQEGEGRLRAQIKQGKLFMIDLAGSERASQTQVCLIQLSNQLSLRLTVDNNYSGCSSSIL